MADINNVIQFDNWQCQLIENKKLQTNFSYKNWSDDDLEPLRCAIRDFYRNQQKGKCAYCKGDISLVSALNSHVEHIVPKSVYEKFIFTPQNLCAICADCNQIKREKETISNLENVLKKEKLITQYPKTSKAFKIVHPHFDNYDDHIVRLDGGYYLDKTDKGSFTIQVCRLNRKLHKFGWGSEIINEPELIECMTNYLDSKDLLSKIGIINKLKDILIKI